MKGNIIFRDGLLALDLNRLLSQVMHVINGVNERNLEVEAWLQLSVVLLESVQ